MSAVLESFFDGRMQLAGGDCLAVMAAMPENSIDGAVTDPPYFLPSIEKRFGTMRTARAIEHGDNSFKRMSDGFHGKAAIVGDIAQRVDTWAALFRVMKPGAHVAAFSASKNFGTMQSAMLAAGFEMRDCILDMIDESTRARGFLDSLTDAQRVAFLDLAVEQSRAGDLLAWIYASGYPKGKPLDKYLDRHYLGAHCDDDEFARGPVSHSAAFYASRDIVLKPAFEPIVLARKPLDGTLAENIARWGTGSLDVDGCAVLGEDRARFPANVIHDGSDTVVASFPSDERGSASRYFFNGKADLDDRCGSLHPTVKPISVLRWLVRLLTHPGQTLLDPFAGSGTMGEAALYEGRRSILIEIDPEYQADIRFRAAMCLAGPEERRRAIIKRRDAKRNAGPLFADEVIS